MPKKAKKNRKKKEAENSDIISPSHPESAPRDESVSTNEQANPNEQSPPQISPPAIPHDQIKSREEKPNLEHLVKHQNHSLKILLFTMTAILIIIAGVFFWNNQRTFEYAGLQFEKIKFDQFPLYHAKIPITTLTGQVIANFNLYLRNDPRSLEEIPIRSRIRIQRDALVAIGSGFESCSDTSLAGLSLGQFLGAAGIRAISGTTDKNTTDKPYVSCDMPGTVIITEKADITQIIKEENCYKIQAASCDDLMKATERFILGSIGHSSGYDV